MAQQTRPTDTLPPAKSRRPQARVIAVGCALALTAFIALLIWSLRAGSGDPGGRILAQLKPVGYTLPAGAAVNYRQMFEPHQDSCDGNPATKGWSQVVSQTNFQWSGTPSRLIAMINTRMQNLGWTFSPASGNGQPGGEWTKTLTGGTTADATLTAEPGGSTWTLIALAPPVGRAVSGC